MAELARAPATFVRVVERGLAYLEGRLDLSACSVSDNLLLT